MSVLFNLFTEVCLTSKQSIPNGVMELKCNEKKKVWTGYKDSIKEADYLIIFRIQFHIPSDSDSDSDALSFLEKHLTNVKLRGWWCPELKHLEAQPSLLGREVLREGPGWSVSGRLPRTGRCNPSLGPGRTHCLVSVLFYHKGLEWQWTPGVVTPRWKTVTLSVMWSHSFLGLDEIVCWKLSIWVWKFWQSQQAT